MSAIVKLYSAFAVLIALALSVATAFLINAFVESSSSEAVQEEINLLGLEWAVANGDGLQVHIEGNAPDEATRFTVVSAAGRIVDAGRIIDNIEVLKAEALEAPRFSVEMLRNGDGISLIGLIPAKTGRDFVLESVQDIANGTNVTDMLETADHTLPDGWEEALEFAIASLRNLPRSKISMTADSVTVTAISDSPEEKERIEADLASNTPEGVQLVMNITAPRPVITPFTLRFIIDDKGARFDSCSADTEVARADILRAAVKAGAEGLKQCNIGLGSPTPRWSEASTLAILALKQLGGGSLTISDADISIIAPETTEQSDFDKIIHRLEQVLPDIFSVHAVLPEKVTEGEEEESEFLVTKSPEGLVQIQGRLPDARSKAAVHNFAGALFGAANVNDTSRQNADLPDGWSTRALAGLEALGKLHNGTLIVSKEALSISGQGGDPDVSTHVAQILSQRLREGADYRIDVVYNAALSAVPAPPDPHQCVDDINSAITKQQITFASGKTTINEEAQPTIERIAALMEDCHAITMEIGGHTDSQGREAMNQSISQARAEAVLDHLLSLDILTENLTARGYGESQPIADNDTPEGRQENRRIAFRLVEPAQDGETTETEGSTAEENVEANVEADVEAETTDTGSETTQEEATDEQN